MPNEFDTPRSRVEAILQNMLGAENELPPPKSRIEYYLQKILEEMSGGSTTFKIFNADWVTDSTTAAFCASVNSDPEAVAGMAYLGELTCSDLPFVGNADAVVEIIDGVETSGKVIHIVITSGTTYPYRWEYTYWNNGTDVSGWIAFATTETVQANPTLAGTEPDLAGLEVNGVKYKAGGGGSVPEHLYDHVIILQSGSDLYAAPVHIYNGSATPLTNDQVAVELNKRGSFLCSVPQINIPNNSSVIHGKSSGGFLLNGTWSAYSNNQLQRGYTVPGFTATLGISEDSGAFTGTYTKSSNMYYIDSPQAHWSMTQTCVQIW